MICQTYEIVCEGEGSQTICEGGDEPVIVVCNYDIDDSQVICYDKNVDLYGICIEALLVRNCNADFTIVFRYMEKSEDGKLKSLKKEVVVKEGQVVPGFHIHDTVQKDDKHEYRFMYWKLVRGNMTSSLNVLSDCTFVAVYDLIEMGNGDRQEIPTPKTMILEPDFPQSPFKNINCAYCKKYADGQCHCTYNLGFPRLMDKKDGGKNYPDEYVYVNCPYLQSKWRKNGGVEPVIEETDSSAGSLVRKVHEENDFDVATFLEIDDIELLLRALLKINIDIAHREYFLKLDLQGNRDWKYGYDIGSSVKNIVCHQNGAKDVIICEGEGKPIVCQDTSWIGKLSTGWQSFEPTVEFKFSNLHASNQVENGKLVCTSSIMEFPPSIVPINRDLMLDNGGISHNELFKYYDYVKSLNSVHQVRDVDSTDSVLEEITPLVDDNQRNYEIRPLRLYENSSIQSPIDANGFVRKGLNEIRRSQNQVRTFTSIVKKYRPIVMPKVRDIFNDCINDKSKFQVDLDNDYGIFGWCTIPSKTMVNMEYNEQSIIVPSSYDHANRVGGSNFLQLDRDFDDIYHIWDGQSLVSNIEDTWYYQYNTRDWTYFLKPFFQVNPNNDLYSFMIDSIPVEHKQYRPISSNHLNGVIFEKSNLGRLNDPSFGDIARTCKFLAKYHHNENNLKTLASRYTNMFSYAKLKDLTVDEIANEMNSRYGSSYVNGFPKDSFRYSDEDWIDDYDKTSSYVNFVSESKVNENSPIVCGDESEPIVWNDYDAPIMCYDKTLKYEYNLGHRHSIDDYDDESVWFYITMVSPIEDIGHAIEVEDIMPFVFWWSNRGASGIG